MVTRNLLQKFALSGLLLLSLTGCFNLAGDLNEPAAGNNNAAQLRVRNSLRGRSLENPQEEIRVRLPRGWDIAPTNALHDNADLYAYNADQEMYFLVIGENASAVSYNSLQDNSQEYRRLLASQFDNVAQEEVTQLNSVGGYPASQYLVRGQVQGTPIAYLHTTVEANNRYYQVVAWTSEERYNENRDELQSIISSFEEI
ncbi:MAG: hypothetical protein ICV77_12825 [Cyanobacteria bacterium Co-bin8]|nr:hypothetical protein [Cyanobacteria bacterium Co-bin8]